MKVIIKNNKRIMLYEVLSENGKKYYVDIDSSIESNNINGFLVMWNYVKNKLRKKV